MPILNQGAIDRISRVVNTVETRFDNIADPDTPILQQGGGGGTLIGILDENLTFEGTADVSIFDGASPDGGSDTGDTLADCWTWLLTSGKKLSSGFHVEIDLASKRIIASRECPVDA